MAGPDEHCALVQGFQLDDRRPLLKRAEPGGEELAQHICSVVQQQSATSAELWAALSCVQHATDKENKVCVLLPEDCKQMRCRPASGCLSCSTTFCSQAHGGFLADVLSVLLPCR